MTAMLSGRSSRFAARATRRLSRMMMNKGLFAPLLLILVFTAPAFCQDAAAELTGLLNEFLAGAGRNDVEVHDKFWGDELIYTRSAGSRTTKVELMKGVRAAPPPKTDR